MIQATHRHLLRMPRHMLVAVCIGMLGVLGNIDHASGYEISFSIFYLVPVGVASWYGRRSIGIAMAVVSSTIWLVVDLTSGHQYSHALIPIWNAGVRLGFFAIVAHLLAVQREQIIRERVKAKTDALTGIKNTAGFLSDVQTLWDLASRHGHHTSLAYLDLDNFKSVNDTRGHAEGDAVLRAVAATISDSLRRTDVFGRLGGDEFAILMPETPCEGAKDVLRRVRDAVTHRVRDHGWPITVSIGAVVLQPPYPPLGEALREADALMYRAKQAGRDRVYIEDLGGKACGFRFGVAAAQQGFRLEPEPEPERGPDQPQSGGR